MLHQVMLDMLIESAQNYSNDSLALIAQSFPSIPGIISRISQQQMDEL
jgi:hypothetical protein